MKKIMLMALILLSGLNGVSAQEVADKGNKKEEIKFEKKAEITFDKTSYNFGTFPESNPKVTCVFTFKNTGESPLIIHQAVASCGCTVPEYTKEPIKPGKTGTLKVTYNGAGKYPGHFKKSITVRSNATEEMVRLYIEGDMTPKTDEPKAE